jgi:glycosyltransferase involved in cell wall biosynthesis
MKDRTRTKKVLVVNPYTGGGGAGAASAFLCSLLRDKVADCDVVSVSPEPRAYKHLGILRYAIQYRHLLPRLRQNSDVDIAIFQGLFNLCSVFALRLAKNNNIRIILLLHGDACPDVRNIFAVKSGIIKWIAWQVVCKRILRTADTIVAGSEFEANSVRRVVDNSRIKIIPMISVDNDHSWSENYTGRYFSLKDQRYALYLGRLSREKNIELLIRCWERIKATGKEAVLVIAGEADNSRYREKLIGEINKRGLAESVIFTGWVDGNEKRFLIRNAMCVLVPSIRESFCNVVLEAISSGTYAVFSKGVPWQKIAGTAGVCLGFDEGEWVMAIEHYCCRREKLRIADHIRETIVADYTVARIRALWEEVIGSS